MYRRSIRHILAAAIFGAAAICLSTRTARAADRPNVIVILADDMGFSDLGCYGSEIHTPNIDAMAQQGVRFAQFYNMARCCRPIIPTKSPSFTPRTMRGLNAAALRNGRFRIDPCDTGLRPVRTRLDLSGRMYSDETGTGRRPVSRES
jgi:Sulfatase